MSDTENTPTKSAPTPRHHDEMEEIKQLIERYGKPALTILIVVLIAIAAVLITVRRNHSKEQTASALLSQARSIPDLDAILSDYGKTAVAPNALLSLAKLYFDTSNYEIAYAKYEEFINKYPDHQMLPTAELGRIYCIEARNYDSALSDAATQFGAFAAEHKDSFLAPQAVFGQARCYEQLGQLEEARAVYEDFVANNTEGMWNMRAEDSLNQINKKISASNDGIMPTAEPSPVVTIPETPETISIPETEQ